MKRAPVLTALFACTLAIGGCSASRPAATASMPPKDQENWALPLDEYADQQESLRSYAENLMVARCLDEQGIEWPVPWRPLDVPDNSATLTPTGYPRFNEKLAATYGYHSAPIEYEGKDEVRLAFQKTNDMVQRDPSIGPKDDACLAQARKTIPLPPTDYIDYATGSARQIEDASQHDPAVVTALSAWKLCMDRAGLGGLADTPEEMPGDAKATAWGIGDPSQTSIPADEIRTATADAKCRTSSGYSRALYDANYERQVELVKKNADKLNRIRDELAADKERLLAAATKYAPK